MAAERNNVRAWRIQRAALTLLAEIITIVILSPHVRESSSHNAVETSAVDPLHDPDCYTTEDSLFLCHAAAGMASTPASNTSSNTNDYASKETLIQDPRSERLYGAGSMPMTSRVTKKVFLYPYVSSTRMPRAREPKPYHATPWRAMP